MSLCKVYDQNAFQTAYKTDFCSEFSFLYVTVYMTHRYVSHTEQLQSQIFIASDIDCNSGASEKHLAGGEH